MTVISSENVKNHLKFCNIEVMHLNLLYKSDSIFIILLEGKS